jgi:hypothetical protein
MTVFAHFALSLLGPASTAKLAPLHSVLVSDWKNVKGL